MSRCLVDWTVTCVILVLVEMAERLERVYSRPSLITLLSERSRYKSALGW